MMNKKVLFLLSLFLFTSCVRVSDKLEPKLDYSIEEKHLKGLSSSFAPLSEEEKKEDWARELIIGQAFAKELDYYRALFSFKRAEILLSQNQLMRKLEIQYDILLCYYFGKKYKDVIDYFEKSDLPHADRSFPAFADLLVILYDSYKSTHMEDKATRIYEVIQKSYSGTAEKLELSSALMRADIKELKKIAVIPPERTYLVNMLKRYDKEKKSVSRAQLLNALLPGSGYLYIGQNRTALTAFLVNGLFIAAAYEFFHKGYVACGIITTSLETGWYFGGIYGAGQEAKYYNEQIYTKHATDVMNSRGLFPIFMIQHAF